MPSPAPTNPAVAAPASALPAAPAVTPSPQATRIRLQGRVQVGDTPWAQAPLQAFDLATDKPIALRAWRDTPGSDATAGPPTTARDGTFNVEIPRLPPGTVLKLVISQGRHSLVRLVETWQYVPAAGIQPQAGSPRTLSQLPIAPIRPATDACAAPAGPSDFENNGIPSAEQPAVAPLRTENPACDIDPSVLKSPPVPTEVPERFSMGRGSLTLVPGLQNLDVSPATTAGATAFDGVLRLTYMLSLEIGSEPRAAILNALNQSVQRMHAAFAREPGVAALLLASTNAQGDVTNPGGFRQALSQTGVFSLIQNALQEALRGISQLELGPPPAEFAPISGADFPTMDVVISPRGWLGFPGQEQPIQLPVTGGGSFTVTPSRGGGGGAPPVAPETVRVFNLTHVPDSQQVRGMAYIRGLSTPALGLVRGSGGVTLFQLPDGPDTAAPWALPTWLRGMAQTQNPASTTVYISGGPSSNSNNIVALEPTASPTISTPVITGSSASQIRAIAAGTQLVYWALNKVSAPIFWFSQSDPHGASGAIEVGSSPLQLDKPQAFAVDESGGATPTLFIGTVDGNVYQVQDGVSSATLATGLGDIYGLAYATPHLYVSSENQNKVWHYDLTQSPLAPRLLVSTVGAGGQFQTDALVEPRGMVLDGSYLYIQCNDGVPTASGSTKVVRVRLP
jgi:hypothetical protein